MKFHYVLIVLLFIRCFAYIGQIPEVLDAEEIVRGTAFDWYGKLSVSVVAVMIGMSGIGAYLLLKRKESGVAVSVIYIAIETVYRIVSDLVGKKIDYTYQTTAGYFAVAYLALIVIIFVYYEKRKLLFESNKPEKHSEKKKREFDIGAYFIIVGYLLIAITHFYASYVLYHNVKFWFFMVTLLVPGIGDVASIYALITLKEYIPIVMYAVSIILFFAPGFFNGGERK